jgi:sugar lactone lactonase YvrE
LNIIFTICFYFAALSLQGGTTVGGLGNGTAGSALNALQSPVGLALDYNGSLYVGDSANERVIMLQNGSLVGAIVAGTGVTGSGATQLDGPGGIYVDTSPNIYISDFYNSRVMLWRKNSSTGTRVAGTGSAGSTSNQFNGPVGLVVDSMGNLYVSDAFNHRVMKWAPNATSGTLVAGTGVAGSGAQQLNRPYGIYLDEYNSYLYIADINNHRLQRQYLGVTPNVTTVAGGYGSGTSSYQLNSPTGVYVSKNTGAMYIVDCNNNRIQRWNAGATSGVTIAGIGGSSGTNATLFNTPVAVLLDPSETYMYVSDTNNNRVQRFTLI